MLFHRILADSTLDWFRRQKHAMRSLPTYRLLEHAINADGDDFDWLQTYASSNPEYVESGAETLTERKQLLQSIEKEIQMLPARQREAFLLRYWEELDVAETAAAMGCSEGSVKPIAFRAVQTLSKALKAQGLNYDPRPRPFSPNTSHRWMNAPKSALPALW